MEAHPGGENPLAMRGPGGLPPSATGCTVSD